QSLEQEEVIKKDEVKVESVLEPKKEVDQGSSEPVPPSTTAGRRYNLRNHPPRNMKEPDARSNRDYCAVANEPADTTGVFTPETYNEAMQSPWADHWNEAMNEEVTALHQLDVFDEVPEESWMKIISSKWVYNIKWKPEGPIDRFKARLVARGFTQMFGVDFWDTFAPTVMATSIRTFLTVCKIKGFLVHQVDVKTAFLNGDIDGEIYVRPPEPYYVPGKVWKLKKALYGLKQSPRCWSQKLNEIMAHLGFQPLKADRCIFARR